MAHFTEITERGTTNRLTISETHGVFAVINGAFGKRGGLSIRYDRFTDTNYFMVNGQVTELRAGMLVLEKKLRHEPERYTTRQNATMMREAFRKAVGRDLNVKPR